MCLFLFIRSQKNKQRRSSLIEIRVVKDVKTAAAHLEKHLTTQRRTSQIVTGPRQRSEKQCNYA